MERGEERKIAYFPLTVYEIATVLRYIISITFLCLQHLCTAAGTCLGFSCMEISDGRGGGGKVLLCIPHNMGTGVVLCWVLEYKVCCTDACSTQNLLLPDEEHPVLTHQCEDALVGGTPATSAYF